MENDYEPVESKDDVLENFFRFQKIRNGDSKAYNHFSRFSKWYYLKTKEGEYFAPYLFLGYIKSTINNYCTEQVDQRKCKQAHKVLDLLFEEVDPGSQLFCQLFEKLEDFAKTVGKKLNEGIKKGSGGIYFYKC